MKRTVFEVAPAGKYSRRHLCVCVPSPPKNLCSLLIAASQKPARWQFYTEFDKSSGEKAEEVRYRQDEGGEKEERRVGGKTEGEVESLRLNVNTVTFQGSAASCSRFCQSPGALASTPAWRTLQRPPTSAALPLCIHLINPHCSKHQRQLNKTTASHTIPSVLLYYSKEPCTLPQTIQIYIVCKKKKKIKWKLSIVSFV